MNENQTILWGFLRRRQCVFPTWRGWLLLVALCAVSAVAAVKGAYPFLAMNAPLRGGILVVEGWGPDSFMADALKEYQSGGYDGLYTTGGPVDEGAGFTKHHTYAELAAAVLQQMGADPKTLHAVPARGVAKDRTYESAIALKKWLSEHDVNVKAITVMTMGAHARRSHLLFEKAFGGSVPVGVISVYDQSINPPHWWTNSAGFREVTDEMIAYFYARFLFHAPKE